MTSDTERLTAAFRDAAVAIQAAQSQNLLPSASGIGHESTMLARMEMLAQALSTSRNGAAVRERPDSRDWEYARFFGYMTRLAVFEVLLASENQGWKHLRDLFRIYFGSEIDMLAPSIFLAAAFHPEVIVSRKLQRDIEDICRAVAGDETAYQSLQASDLLD